MRSVDQQIEYALSSKIPLLCVQVDMYSFGVILWELITTEVPRRGRLRAIKVGTPVCWWFLTHCMQFQSGLLTCVLWHTPGHATRQALTHEVLLCHLYGHKFIADLANVAPSWLVIVPSLPPG